MSREAEEKMKKKTGKKPLAVVLFGGVSVESDVSVVTGLTTATAMRKNFDVIGVFVDGDGVFRLAENNFEPRDYAEKSVINRLKKCAFLPGGKICVFGKFGFRRTIKPDFAVLCFHGGSGENGGMAGLLEACGIPCVNGGTALQAVAMDKILTKFVASALKIPVLPHVEVGKTLWERDEKGVFPQVFQGFSGNGDAFGFRKIVDDANCKCRSSADSSSQRQQTPENSMQRQQPSENSDEVEVAYENKIVGEVKVADKVEIISKVENSDESKFSDKVELTDESERSARKEERKGERTCGCGGKCGKERTFRENVFRIAESLVFPLIVKPASLGSSVGVRCVHSPEELREALDVAFRFDGRALIEPKPDVYELNVAAGRLYGKTVVTPAEKPLGKHEILDFADKYVRFGKKGSDRIFPFDSPVSEEIRRATRKIFDAFSGRGIIRADFLVTNDGFYLNEINAIPGSMAHYLFDEDFPELMLELYKQLQADNREKTDLIRKIKTPLLTGKGLKNPK